MYCIFPSEQIFSAHVHVYYDICFNFLKFHTIGYYCVRGAHLPNPQDFENITTLFGGVCLCPSNSTGGECQPGFYCPKGSKEPIPCEEGQYCGTPGKKGLSELSMFIRMVLLLAKFVIIKTSKDAKMKNFFLLYPVINFMLPGMIYILAND